MPCRAYKLAVLLKRTRQAGEEVERALFAKLGSRINVMGEFNQLLQGWGGHAAPHLLNLMHSRVKKAALELSEIQWRA